MDDDGPWLYYKLTNEPKGSGELKIDLRIISKPHAYLQTMTKTLVKFEKDCHKTAGGVAHTRYPLSIHFNSIQDCKMSKFKMWKKVTKINLRIISKPYAHL